MFVSEKTVRLFAQFVLGGGTIVWSGVPALRGENGENMEGMFLDRFGLEAVQKVSVPMRAACCTVQFEGILKGVAPMEIRTDFLPDFVYPITPDCADVVARIDGIPVGTIVSHGVGRAVYLGFRPRDDQSKSLGTDVSTMFDILTALDAYSPDSLEARSRPESARYIMNRFPNGAVCVANHYRTFEERWYGSFFRDEARDEELLRGRALPPVEILLENEEILGRRVRYSGTDALTYREDCGKLMAFAGDETDGIEIDGVKHALFDKKASIAFVHMEKRHLAEGIDRLLFVKTDRPGVFTLDLPEGFDNAACEACELDYLRTAFAVPCVIKDGRLTIEIGDREKGLWIAVYTLT